MTHSKTIELVVGLFILVGIAGLLFLAFKVGDVSQLTRENSSYTVTANFDNIGDLKVRAPVSIAGVKVGEITDIELTPDTFSALVTMKIVGSQNKIPVQDTSAIIQTEGLLGSNYISIIPGYNYDLNEGSSSAYLHNGSHIERTQSALILENLIGSLLFNINQ